MSRQKVQVGRKATHLTGVIAPYESDIQAAAFEYMKTLRLPNGHALWDYAYAVPNGAMLAGDSAQRARMMNSMKRQGLKTGVSDIVIALPLDGFHGAYIEVKRNAKSPISDEQKAWSALMKSVGYYTRIVAGQDALFAAITDYWRGSLLRVVLP